MQSFSTSDLIRWAQQIANGMDFLSNNRIVHRDLAARNILINEAKSVKICDFGLAKDVHSYGGYVYARPSRKRLPFRWMAPESLSKAPIFSSNSDVWSYGED